MHKHNPGATPLYAAALTGSYSCIEQLLLAGAKVNAKNLDGSTPLLVSCQEGHLQTSMLLSSYSASRETGRWRGKSPKCGTWAEELAQRRGHTELVRWLRDSSGFSPLHHVEVLTPERTLSLLHEGYSPVASRGRLCSSPAELARTLADSAAAELILGAAAPWSPETHRLWSRAHQDRAVVVVKMGYLLARQYAGEHTYSMTDVWLANIMPRAITWERASTVESGARRERRGSGASR